MLECFAVMSLKLEMDATAALGFLQPFYDDANVEEIWVNRPGELFVSRAGVTERVELPFSDSQLSVLIERMLRSAGRRIDRAMPFVDATLPSGSRLHAVIPDITKTHASLNIRKFQLKRPTLNTLLAASSITNTQATVLRNAARAGNSILISGATQAGKTTLLCALLAELDDGERIVSVEDTFELSIPNPDWVAMQTRPASVEGSGEVDLRRLVREVLRMRPTRIVVGEVRGAEALDLLVALNSGLPGLCTIHANSSIEAISKLQALPLLAGSNISREFLVPTIARSVDLVVHCVRDANGKRRVAEIGRVVRVGTEIEVQGLE